MDPVTMDVVHPRYGTASLADVLPSVLAALTAAGPGRAQTPSRADPLGLAAGPLAGVRRVAVLLVDGLGQHQIPLAAPHAPTLADLATGRLAAARVLTSGFPSTTPVSLVTLGTGAPPGSHGVLGFTVRVPGTDRVLNHIYWSGDPDPATWQPVPTQFQRAIAAGVSVSVVGRPEYDGSGLTTSAYRGAPYRGAVTPDEVAAEALAALRAGDPPVLVYAYHPDLDMLGHLCGVDSAQWRTAAQGVDALLSRLVDGLPEDAALVVTADHGQLNVPAEHRIDLDDDPRLRAGLQVVAGEPRVRYLHTAPGARDDVISAWRGVLGDAAWVASREEAVAAGWFGPVPEAHLQRVGDVVVVCHDRYAVLATRTEPPMVSRLVAYHGSYTPVEMEIPLLIARPAGRVGGTG